MNLFKMFGRRKQGELALPFHFSPVRLPRGNIYRNYPSVDLCTFSHIRAPRMLGGGGTRDRMMVGGGCTKYRIIAGRAGTRRV